MSRLLLSLLVLAGLAAGTALVWLVRSERCAGRCRRALTDAEELAREGDFVAALEHLDSIDAACRCSRFTAGDEPPEYAAARYWVSEIERRQELDDLRRLRRLKPRGSILSEILAP